MPVIPKIGWQFGEENGRRRTTLLQSVARSRDPEIGEIEFRPPVITMWGITREPRQTKPFELLCFSIPRIEVPRAALSAHKGGSLYYFCFVFAALEGFPSSPTLPLPLRLSTRISSNHASPFPSLPTFFRLSFFRGSPPPPRLFDNPIIRPFFSARKTFLFRRFKDNRARLEAIEHPLLEIRLPTLARFSRAFQIRSFPSFPDFH